MAHYKRKRSRRVVRCTLCTPHRWLGNAKGRFGKQPRRSSSRRPKRAELVMGAEDMLATQVSFEPQGMMTVVDVPVPVWADG